MLRNSKVSDVQSGKVTKIVCKNLVYSSAFCKQWRTQKIFMGAFHIVAYGGHLYLVSAVCDGTI